MRQRATRASGCSSRWTAWTRARLYFRGPFGERFMLRELALRAGLDEVGQRADRAGGGDVDGRAAALGGGDEPGGGGGGGCGGGERSAADRDRAPEHGHGHRSRAGHGAGHRGTGPASRTRSREPGPRPDRELRDATALDWLLGVHLAGQWTGPALGPRYGAALEVGRMLVRDASLRLRVRAVFEPSLSQTLEHDAVEASVMSWPLRLGLDVGFAGAIASAAARRRDRRRSRVDHRPSACAIRR